MIRQLKLNRNLEELLPESLAQLCQSFHFDCGFSYQRDYSNLFRLNASYTRDGGRQLPASIPLAEALGEPLLARLRLRDELLIPSGEDLDDPLDQALLALFRAQRMVLIPLPGPEGGLASLMGLANWRSERRHAESDLKFCASILSILSSYVSLQTQKVQAEDAKASLENVLDHMGVDVYVSDLETNELLYLNHSMAAPYGPVEALIGKPCHEVFHDRLDAQIEFARNTQQLSRSGKALRSYASDFQRARDGAWFRVFCSVFEWFNGRMARVVSSVDITESKRNEEIIRQMAEFDFLTGLPNRYALSQLIDLRADPSNPIAKPFYLIFFDLDGFKTVNDTLGHKAGDELLRKIAATLQKNPLTRHKSYRYGGDEFVVLVEGESHASLDAVIAFLRHMFSNPWPLNEGEAQVGASLGISAFPQDAVHTGDLIRKADLAMYASKRAGKGKAHFYSPGGPLPLDSFVLGEP